MASVKAGAARDSPAGVDHRVERLGAIGHHEHPVEQRVRRVRADADLDTLVGLGREPASPASSGMDAAAACR